MKQTITIAIELKPGQEPYKLIEQDSAGKYVRSLVRFFRDLGYDPSFIETEVTADNVYK